MEAPQHQPIDDGSHTNAPRGRLRKFFETSIKLKASDLHIKPYAPVRLRLGGELRAADAPPFEPEELLKTVERAIVLYEAKIQKANILQEMEMWNKQLTGKVEHLTQENQDLRQGLSQ